MRANVTAADVPFFRQKLCSSTKLCSAISYIFAYIHFRNDAADRHKTYYISCHTAATTILNVVSWLTFLSSFASWPRKKGEMKYLVHTYFIASFQFRKNDWSGRIPLFGLLIFSLFAGFLLCNRLLLNTGLHTRFDSMCIIGAKVWLILREFRIAHRSCMLK